jgi:hypothetical protein
LSYKLFIEGFILKIRLIFKSYINKWKISW